MSAVGSRAPAGRVFRLSDAATRQRRRIAGAANARRPVTTTWPSPGLDAGEDDFRDLQTDVRSVLDPEFDEEAEPWTFHVLFGLRSAPWDDDGFDR